ncbi:MAG: hypothetical protein WKF29_01210 [Thermoleophilaceae bacterium]
MSATTIDVLDGERPIAFSFEDMLDYHGPGSPGGVAHAFKVLERGLPLLEPYGLPQRREIGVRTAFGGPGARDAFELITRAVTDDRYEVDPALALPERGRERERFVFSLTYRDRAATLTLREGYVSEEFIDLARKDGLSEDEDRRLALLKLEMAALVMSLPAAEVYDAL